MIRMKKVLLTILGILIGIPILLYLIGFTIPESHTATVTRTFSAPPGAVWEAITDVKNYAAWRDNVKEVEILSDTTQPLKWREFYTNNDPLTFEVTEQADSTRFVARIADQGLPFGGTWTYRVSEQSGGTVLTITEEGEIYNPLFRTVAKFFFGYSATMEQYAGMLENKLEQ